ncbi:uncharacterized protein TNCV_4352001 [Trichonephila clavipes]|nr:uncharacterized protein TNCV_4352001 [Trichonephila clavipes]
MKNNVVNHNAVDKGLKAVSEFTPSSLFSYSRAFGDGPRSFETVVAEWYRYRTVTCLVTSSSPVPLKTRRVGQRCTLNLSRAETSSRWCGVVVRRGGCQLRCRPRFKITWSIAKSPRVAEQCDINIQSINQLVVLSHGQMTRTISKLAPPLLTSTLHQREDV